MKTNTKIALAVAAGAAALLLKKNKTIDGIGATKYQSVVAKLVNAQYRNSTMYGNPSYWVLLETPDGDFVRGYTSPNAALAYGIDNSDNHNEFKEWVYTSGKRGKSFHYARKINGEIDGLISHLVPNDSRKSFYGKAVLDDQGDYIILYSYDTPVVQYDKSAGVFYIMPNGEFAPDGKYSATTTRHIRAFAAQLGINVGNARVGAYS